VRTVDDVSRRQRGEQVVPLFLHRVGHVDQEVDVRVAKLERDIQRVLCGLLDVQLVEDGLVVGGADGFPRIVDDVGMPSQSLSTPLPSVQPTTGPLTIEGGQ
jgi:hypothetical protein